MEKLIELFNEYERPQTNHIYTAYEVKENMNRLDILQEFIKWLVDNDKIDHKIYEDMKFTAIKQGVLIDKKSGSTAQETREIIKNGCIDTFIALLAIQDKPIEFLISILK